MIDDMGIFRTSFDVANTMRPRKRVHLRDVMVDTGSEYSWVAKPVLQQLGIKPEWVDAFETADGRIIERPVGFALFLAAGRSSPTVVVFAEPSDSVLLGAHALEGLNLRVDLVLKELIPAGPVRW